jgi:hypothetical protein
MTETAPKRLLEALKLVGWALFGSFWYTLVIGFVLRLFVGYWPNHFLTSLTATLVIVIPMVIIMGVTEHEQGFPRMNLPVAHATFEASAAFFLLFDLTSCLTAIAITHRWELGGLAAVEFVALALFCKGFGIWEEPDDPSRIKAELTKMTWRGVQVKQFGGNPGLTVPQTDRVVAPDPLEPRIWRLCEVEADGLLHYGVAIGRLPRRRAQDYVQLAGDIGRTWNDELRSTIAG